ncbi:hypothetical protein HYC85_025815 [Camellia sinensis]|uniref:Prohibitin n=1 Tax=Camellia sinensis TaxID=4442 RepID=A0A7J7G5W0_CAMSI|nr:hypothetical protein HYC85_025815 [Camellia sinensis]
MAPKAFIFDIRTRFHTFSSISGTKDLQRVNLILRVLSRPEVSQFSPNLPNPRPQIRREILKAVVAQFNTDHLFTERPSVFALVHKSLVRCAKDFNIVLDDVVITHLSSPRPWSRSRWRSRRQRGRNSWWPKRSRKLAAIIRAESESEAAKLISDATAAAGMGLIKLRKIEALRGLPA